MEEEEDEEEEERSDEEGGAAEPKSSEEGEERAGSRVDKRKKICSVCGKRFWSLQDLTRHMRSHTGTGCSRCPLGPAWDLCVYTLAAGSTVLLFHTSARFDIHPSHKVFDSCCLNTVVGYCFLIYFMKDSNRKQ